MVKTMRELYPHMNDEELQEAEENMTQYAAFLLRMFKRMKMDGTLNQMVKNSNDLID